uniref:HAT C-terminal dimerisation domain-containing protein n=1 Tax=Meloidogyne enterolobii TaxID=390850 RepID=A0A6V7W6A3_MELEN|nr:unnamed protein product [Meloidogyne enterolobii]
MVAKIWKFFEVKIVNGEKMRKCLKCGDMLPTPQDHSTGNMINHLKKKGHEKELEEYNKPESNQASDIRSHFSKNEQRINEQWKLDQQLVRIMVRQDASTCFFDDPDLQNLRQNAYPNIQIHGHKYFTREVIPKMAKDIREKIIKNINQNKFAITSDGWQKPSKFPALLSVTIHVVNTEFERFDDIFATIVLENEHTGEEIARLIENSLMENGLQIGQISACVRDAAKNMQKACRLLELESFQCSAHLYHLAVTESLNSNETIKNLINVVRQWVGGTHRSNLAQILKKYQQLENLPTNRIPIDVVTRWGSTFMMLEAFNQMKSALIKTQDELKEVEFKNRKPPEISQNNWNNLKRLSKSLHLIKREDFVIIGELCRVLKIFHVETCRLSEEQSIASTYIPTLKKILSALQLMEIKIRCTEIKEFTKILIENLKRRMISVMDNQILKLSMLIDPRFAYSEDYLHGFEWEELEEDMIGFILKDQKDDMITGEMNVSYENEDYLQEEDSMDIDIWAQRTQSPSTVSQFSTDSQKEIKLSIKAELCLFKNNSLTNRPSRNDDIFAWWKKFQHGFPQLAQTARTLLAKPATSVSSERTFSFALTYIC